MLSALASIIGPENVPDVAFEDATRERLFAP
jgi:hypothetical protein